MTVMKKLTAYRVDVEGIDGIGFAKLDGIIKGYGNVINSYWIGIFASISFTYNGDATRDQLLGDLTNKIQVESIQGRIKEFKEISLGKLADPKYAPRLKVTKLEKKEKEKNKK